MAEEYRRFWLINGNNDRYDFTLKEQNVFLHKPMGLGFTKTIETVRIGNSEKKTSEQYELPTVSGNILFLDTVAGAYYAYKEFIKFISYEPLTLHYQTPDTLDSFYMDCDITTVSKDEYEETLPYLECPATFTGLSLWKNDKELSYTITKGTESGGKHYPLVRDYYYPGSTFSNIKLIVNSTVKVGFELIIDGECVNPQLIASQNDKAYGKLKLDGTFSYIRVNSDDADEEIYLEKDSMELSNPYSYQDPTIADGSADITFFKLPVGTSILSFSCENMSDFNGTVKFRWKDELVSV